MTEHDDEKRFIAECSESADLTRDNRAGHVRLGLARCSDGEQRVILGLGQTEDKIIFCSMGADEALEWSEQLKRMAEMILEGAN
jgi:hypothetical protein